MNRYTDIMTTVQLLKNILMLKNVYFKLFISEFIGTFILLFLGTCTSSQHAFGHPKLISDSSTFGWGLSVTMAVLVTGGISGAHINPAVSFAYFSIGQLKITELLVYWIAQYIGAFVGSACAFGVYYEALNINDDLLKENFEINETLLSWITFPKLNIRPITLFFDQVLGTMMLMLFVLAIGDEKNMNVPKGLRPLCVGFAVTCIMLALSHNCGAALNPARDFGPRAFISVIGYGYDIFMKHNYFFWIPLVAPHIGAVIGAYLYVVLISWNLTSQNVQISQAPAELTKITNLQ